MSSLLRRLAAVLGASSVVAVLSCEAIVSDTVPGFNCEGTDPAACPEGQYCNGSGCKACEPQDVCDHYDNDCNGKVDDGPLSDADGDGYSWCGDLDATKHPTNVDCDDTDPAIHPGATEVCDGKDNDCNGKIDDGATCAVGAACINGKCITPCDPNNTISCPGGKRCDPVTLQCVNITTVGIGQACKATSECDAPYFCADASIVGANVLPTNAPGVCTSACCSSSQCPQGFVCYSPGSSGHFCVDPAKIGRAVPGSDPAGASDTVASRCRSGEIVNGKCADTCCSDGDCTNGTHCAYGHFDNHDGFFCQQNTGNGVDGDFCTGQGSCRDLICSNWTCLGECCGYGSCGANGIACAYGKYGSSPDLIPVCFQGSLGNGVLGSTCSTSNDCATNICYDDLEKGLQYCSDVCCVDADCGSGYLCRPSPQVLRCVKK